MKAPPLTGNMPRQGNLMIGGMFAMLNEPMLIKGQGSQIADGAIVYPIEVNSPFKMTTFEVQPGCETAMDQHQVAEIWVILEGSGDLRYEDKSLTVERGQIFYFSSYKTHQIKNTGTKVLKILSMYW
jgi:mannose-6-phosphate isomerase-like protein (cupin superfamily)